MTRLLVVLVMAAACGGSSPKSSAKMAAPAPDEDPIPTSAGPECSVVAEKLAIVVEAERPDAQASSRELILARCTEDTWSDEARSCFATVENDDEVDGCKKKLSLGQRLKMGGEAPAAADSAPTAPAPGGAKATPMPATAKKKGQTRSADPEEGGE